MGTVVWLVPLAGAHSRGISSYLRERAFDVRECDPERWPPVAGDRVAGGVLVVDVADLDDDAGGPRRFANVGLPHFFLLPGGGGIDAWLSRCHVEYFAIKPVSLEAIESYLRILVSKSLDPVREPAPGAAPRGIVGVQNDVAAGHADGAVVIDGDTKCVQVEGREIHLTPKEFDLFSLLASRPGHVFSTEEIISRVWKGRRRATSLDVQQYVHHLRRKVEFDPASPRRIRNVKGFGYLLDCGDAA